MLQVLDMLQLYQQVSVECYLMNIDSLDCHSGASESSYSET